MTERGGPTVELSRVDAGRDDDQRELVDVHAVAAQSIAGFGLEVGVLAGADIPVLHELNSLRFERTLANLLENAARYGGGATRVECRHIGGSLRVTVDDDGPGVPEHERTSIFGRFHRGSATVGAGQSKGTGLGLSLVDEYVRMEGGTVRVESSPSGGARFIVEIPERS